MHLESKGSQAKAHCMQSFGSNLQHNERGWFVLLVAQSWPWDNQINNKMIKEDLIHGYYNNEPEHT